MKKTSFYNVINLCISNKGGFVILSNGASFLVLGVLRIMKKKGFIQFFQKSSSGQGSFSFKMHP